MRVAQNARTNAPRSSSDAHGQSNLCEPSDLFQPLQAAFVESHGKIDGRGNAVAETVSDDSTNIIIRMRAIFTIYSCRESSDLL